MVHSQPLHQAAGQYCVFTSTLEMRSLGLEEGGVWHCGITRWVGAKQEHLLFGLEVKGPSQRLPELGLYFDLSLTTKLEGPPLGPHVK